MKKLIGFLFILASLGGIGFLYYRSGIVEKIQKDEPVELMAPFHQLANDFPVNILLLAGSIGFFLYSFSWFMARKAPRMPPVRKTGDPEADRRAARRRQAMMAANVKIPPRMPGALLINSFFMLTAVAVLVVGVYAQPAQDKSVLGLISLVIGAQLAVGILFMLMALVWEKSLFRMGSMLALLVHLVVAGGAAFSILRGLPTLQ
jgi:hypothetical protein